MDIIDGFTTYDLVIFALLVLLVARGMWLGLLKQVTGLVALYLGYFAASHYSDRIVPLLRDISENSQVLFFSSYILLFLATYIVVMLLGKALGYVVQLTIATWFDRLLGGAVGFAKACILIVIVHMVLGSVLAPEKDTLRACKSCDILNEVTDFTRELIRDREVREAFLQQQPAIAVDAIKGYLSSEQTPTSQKDTAP